MKLKGKLLFLFFLFHVAIQAKDDSIQVGILSKQKIYHCSIKIQRGTYAVIADGKYFCTLLKSENLAINYLDSLEIRTKGKIIKAKDLKLKGQDYVNHFTLKVGAKKRIAYDDNLQVYHGNSYMQLINTVALENYVSAVVEGEAGYSLPQEYYKLQAILCRTYALKNMQRHLHQGYNICDKVHCQVYHHKCTKSEIYEATIATNSLVVVDEKLNLINTIFHANCGGETCNSEDVWGTALSYLRCVTDSFCTSSRSSYWKKSYPKTKLYSYFNVGKKRTKETELYSFCQADERHADTRLLNKRLTKIRKDLKLRSTYFFADEKGDSVMLYGRGYGHGVGLCQQGGIEMAYRKYSYVDILKKYYVGINIINRKALNFFLE